jgi:hypothetical protein
MEENTKTSVGDLVDYFVMRLREFQSEVVQQEPGRNEVVEDEAVSKPGAVHNAATVEIPE